MTFLRGSSLRSVCALLLPCAQKVLRFARPAAFTVAVSVVALGVSQAGAETPQLAPLNPAFTAATPASNAMQTTAGGKALGHRQGPQDFSLLKQSAVARAAARSAAQSARTYATAFDLRDTGKVSAVKNQSTCGACWAFASLASLESSLLSGESWDFSENNLKNKHGFDWTHCAGGTGNLATAYLARWGGPITEADDPYSVSSSVSPSGLTVRKHLQNTKYFAHVPGTADNDAIKQALTTIGAVDASMTWSDSAYRSATASYYYSGSDATDHDVTIVGWNDDYGKSNFSPAPSSNGAWLVKNSWGTGWGNSGYFWVSYYDAKFAEECYVFYDAQATTNYSRIYQYDPLGRTSAIGYGSVTAWGANIFTVADSGTALKAVGFYTMDAPTAYELRVYTNVTAGSPRSGTLAYSTSGSIAEAGYHTVTFTAIPVTASQNFSVVLRFTTNSYTYPVPLEYPIAGYSSGATASTGQSYMSSNGTSWTDVAGAYTNTNVSIKAYAGPSGETFAVTSVSPQTAVNSGSTSLTVTGTAFTSPSTLRLSKTGQSNISATSVTVNSSTQITAVVPLTDAAAGLWSLTVVNSGAETATLADALTITLPLATVSAISPASGISTGTLTGVSITGTNFRTAAAVKLARTGYTDVNATSLTVNSASSISCSLPLSAVATGVWNITVTNTDDGQSGSLANGFTVALAPTPTISSVSPASGISTGTLAGVALTGTNFRSGAAVKLTRTGYSDVNATGVTVNSATSISCSLPLNEVASGAWNVVVTNTDDGQSVSLNSGFTVSLPAAPVLTAISPPTAYTDTDVNMTFTGSHFRSGDLAVLSKGSTSISVTATYVSPTQLSCSMPLAGAATGVWNVSVTDEYSQTSTLSSAFTISLPAPVIQTVSPSTATNVGNAPLSIGGTNFYSGITAKLTKSGESDITSASLTRNSATSLLAVFTLTNAAAGPWTLVLTNEGGLNHSLSDALTITQASTATVSSASGGTLTFAYSTTQATLNVPAGAFSQNTVVSMATPNGALAQAASKAATLSSTGVALQINTDLGSQPLTPILLTMGYTPADISGLTESRLIIARYNEDKSLWVPLPSTVNTSARTVSAYLDHFSLFSIMQSGAVSDLSSAKCYPNPMRPARGVTYARMNFTALPSGSTVKIYTFAGELARSLDADSSGMAVWDGKNSSGQDMASGVYLALVEKDGSKKIIKVAIER